MSEHAKNRWQKRRRHEVGDSDVSGACCEGDRTNFCMENSTHCGKCNLMCPVGDAPLYWSLQEGALAASLEHAYHYLNFAWNGRFKTMREADVQFDRNEKFPRPRDKCGWFAKFWPKSLLLGSK